MFSVFNVQDVLKRMVLFCKAAVEVLLDYTTLTEDSGFRL